MANQLLINPFPTGQSSPGNFQDVSGSIALCGSAVSTGEPLNWSSIVTGIGYNEINFQGNGIHGQNTALTTGFAVSAGVVTVTAANNFAVGQQVTFLGNTGTLSALFNGQTVTVVSATSSQFTAATTNTGTTTTGDVGLAVSGQQWVPLARPRGAAQNLTVTALSASAGVITVTAANNLLPGGSVTISVATGTLGPKLTGTYTVASATSTAFTFVNASTGSTGTGTAVGQNCPQPFDVMFWSANGSGYTYQYAEATGVLYCLQVPASASLGSAAPQSALAAAAYPAGVLADVIKYRARFAKA